MNKRRLKQFLYGAGFLGFFFLICFSAYLLWLKPSPNCSDRRQNQEEAEVDCGGPCEPCEIRYLSLPEIISIKTLPSDDKTAVFAEIKNPNSDWGAESISYDLEIFDMDGNKMESIEGKTLIYPGEINHILEVLDIPSKNISRAEITFSDPQWKSKEQFFNPNITAKDAATESTETGKIAVSGTLSNSNSFSVSKTMIISALFNQSGTLIAASKTEIDDIGPRSEKSFRVNFPSGFKLRSALSKISFSKNLTIGSSSSDVNRLQTFLKDKGFFFGEPSNYFGQSTKTALINYQKSVGISPASGILSSQTRTQINNAISAPSNSLIEADPNKTQVYIESVK